MSLLAPFLEAHALLGDGDAAAIKRAYRAAVIAHPPDTDPEGFRRVRAAYELLTDPQGRVREMLLSELPAVDPPELAVPELPSCRGATAVAVLRAAAMGIDSDELTFAPPREAPPRAPRMAKKPT